MYKIKLFSSEITQFEKIKCKFKQIEEESRLDVKKQFCIKIADGKTIYDHAIRKRSLELYEFTKYSLQTFNSQLSAEEKGIILKLYGELWLKMRCRLDLTDTEYAHCSVEEFHSPWHVYAIGQPMIAGFNLSGATFPAFLEPDVIFHFVDFSNTIFTKTQFPCARFENCNFKDMKVGQQGANFNQCQFVRCNFQGADIKSASLDGASFQDCNLKDTRFHKPFDRITFRQCLFEEEHPGQQCPAVNI